MSRCQKLLTPDEFPCLYATSVQTTMTCSWPVWARVRIENGYIENGSIENGSYPGVSILNKFSKILSFLASKLVILTNILHYCNNKLVLQEMIKLTFLLSIITKYTLLPDWSNFLAITLWLMHAQSEPRGVSMHGLASTRLLWPCASSSKKREPFRTSKDFF